MSHIVVCATPAPGHVNPMLRIASSLATRGHDITFTTSDVFKQLVQDAGLRFVPFIKQANIDYRALDQRFPHRAHTMPGVERLIHDFQHVFFDVIPDQHRTLDAIEKRSPIDLILTDTMFLGTFPRLLNPQGKRPPVISCGITPLFFLTSRDYPPFGAPEPAGDEPRDYRPLHRDFHAALQPAHEHLAAILRDMNAPPLQNFFLDAMVTLPDRYLQLTGNSFEFPSSDIPENVRFVGPIQPAVAVDFREPEWWREVDSRRPVVLVTQGTIANTDFSELLEPSIQALAGEDVTVVASLGTEKTRILSVSTSENVHVVPFIPFDKVMPHVDVFITNGGYGAVNQALQNGVPMIVAGTTEDKPFVAARVAWSGSGIDLQTDRPTPDQIRTAVREILANATFRDSAQWLASSFRQYDALGAIASEVEWEIQIALGSEVLQSVAV